MIATVAPMCAWLLLIFTAGLRRDPERGRQDALAFIYFTTFVGLGFALQYVVIYLRPTTYDAQFLAADRALGLDPIAVMAWIKNHQHIGDFLGFIYISLPGAMILTWLIEQNLTLRRVQLVGGYLCFVVYLLLPAVGPGVYNWDANAPTHGAMMLWRNCMPSMHFGWALMMARNSKNKILSGFLWVFAGLTGAGTIVVGEHYFIDLIAAVPYVLFIQWLTESVLFGRRAQLSAIEVSAQGPASGKPREVGHAEIVPARETQSLPLES